MNKSRTLFGKFSLAHFKSTGFSRRRGKKNSNKSCAGYALHRVAGAKVLGYSLPVKGNAICSRAPLPFFLRL